ncbi:MAG: AMP-binding protein, partial [Gammaproteobacteria bacterium]
KLGGRLRLAICGGAPLSNEVAKTFVGLGLNLIQGYGLTETSPIISANRVDNNDPASVGEPLEGIEVQVTDNDELITRSQCNMLGYWNNKEATDAIFDADGWLHTGDKARIDNNRIYITGRLKEIIVLSNGKKAPPADIEMAVSMDNLFDQVMVIGDNCPYLSALVVLNQDLWPEFAKSLDVEANEQSLQSDTVANAVLERINNHMREFPGYMQIRRVTLSLDPWTIDNGLITPTMKLKRGEIEHRFQAIIDSMYEGHEPV